MDYVPRRTSTGVRGEVDKEIVDASVDSGRVSLVKASSDVVQLAAMHQVGKVAVSFASADLAPDLVGHIYCSAASCPSTRSRLLAMRAAVSCVVIAVASVVVHVRLRSLTTAKGRQVALPDSDAVDCYDSNWPDDCCSATVVGVSAMRRRRHLAPAAMID